MRDETVVTYDRHGRERRRLARPGESVVCDEHGDTACYLQPDRTHVPRHACICRYPAARPTECPVDAHREAAQQAKLKPRQRRKFPKMPGPNSRPVIPEGAWRARW